MFELTPPQSPLTWEHEPDDVLRLVKGAIEKHKSTLDEIGHLRKDQCDFESVRLPQFVNIAVESDRSLSSNSVRSSLSNLQGALMQGNLLIHLRPIRGKNFTLAPNLKP